MGLKGLKTFKGRNNLLNDAEQIDVGIVNGEVHKHRSCSAVKPQVLLEENFNFRAHFDCMLWTNTKVITTANQIKRNITRNQWKLKVETSNLLETRENTRNQVAFVFKLHLIS